MEGGIPRRKAAFICFILSKSREMWTWRLIGRFVSALLDKGLSLSAVTVVVLLLLLFMLVLRED